MNFLLQSSLLLPLLLGQAPGATDSADAGQLTVPPNRRPGALGLQRPGRPASVPGDTSSDAAPAPAAAPPSAKASTPERALSPAPERMTANCEEVRRKAKFNIYFDKVDIEKLVQTVADATCKTFILGENIKGKISVIGPDNGQVEVSADEFYAAFLAALDANNLAIVPYGKFSKVVEKAKAKQNNIPTITDGSTDYTTNEQMMTRLFKVRYVELEPLRNVVQQLVSTGGDSILFQPDTLIVNDLGGNMHRIERIVEQLDVRSANDEMRDCADSVRPGLGRGEHHPEALRAEGTARDPASDASASSPTAPSSSRRPAATPRTESASPASGASAGAPATLTSLIPDERTNKLIIIASVAANDAHQRHHPADRRADFGRGAHQCLLPGQRQGRGHRRHAAGAGPGHGQSPAFTDRDRNVHDRSTVRASGQPPRPAGAPGVSATELFAGEVKISADKSTNAWWSWPARTTTASLVRVIEKLDIPRRQVFVEAVIMEVDLTRETDFGVSLHQGFTVNTSQGQARGHLRNKVLGQHAPVLLHHQPRRATAASSPASRARPFRR